MSYHSRSVLPAGLSRKRKEREAFYSTPPKPPQSSANKPTASELVPVSANRLLAGYMAHEFLTKGTLFGEKFDPARAGAVQLAGGGAAGAPAEPGRVVAVKQEQKQKEYADVAWILKTDGAHIPGVINPTQLERWIQM